MTRFGKILVAATVAALLPLATVSADVTAIEGGHTLTKLVDSCEPEHPSQALLDSACATGDLAFIESIGVAPGPGKLFVQLTSRPDGEGSTPSSCIFSITPAGIATLINPDTGFATNSRGTDLHLDPATGLLVTLDIAGGTFGRLATLDPGDGTTGTFVELADGVVNGGGTFGADFSRGDGGTDAPLGELVFTTDVSGNGIYSSPAGGPASASHATPPEAGDDMVIQPDGDWIHFEDGDLITAYDPMPPHAASPSALNVSTIFSDAGLVFIFGNRATVCDATGDSYMSFSGNTGGTGIFRIDEALTTASHLVTISLPHGLQDLVVGPSTSEPGLSLFFTVHEFDPLPAGGGGGDFPANDTGCEEVWELTIPECDAPLFVELASLTAVRTKRGVRLDWTTTSEIGHAGFRVLRGRLQPDNPYKREVVEILTPELIPGRGDETRGAEYRFVDATELAPGSYVYYLEDVDVRGQATRHGPVAIEVVPPRKR